ncbi:RNA polymerase sigma factor [Deminuibacter soli]|uniref:Sigma-70 family RNA polymerase sigma factor n=1 Tax=Deminuibacter soli TaxID=2291815 RepID=A0A3E1NDB2_9BACT|nr:sigma-70 family RNA polymerase sigma factor [Deminuibacter soli]RFM25748.1 sigma-70 family RNA polymerase sigma factor [Deminuibacter soli]
MDNSTAQHDFVQLMAANKGILLKICNAYCTSKADREDLAQEIIFTLWKANSTYNPDYKFSTWMYRVALNVAISYYRSTKKTRNTIPFTEMHIDLPDLPAEADAGGGIALLHRHIAALPELDRALIILYFEEKTYREIADIIGITETNAATKISRIKEKLKQQMRNTQTKAYGRP